MSPDILARYCWLLERLKVGVTHDGYFMLEFTEPLKSEAWAPEMGLPSADVLVEMLMDLPNG